MTRYCLCGCGEEITSLVIWEKELEDKETLKNRILEFHNRNVEHSITGH